MKRIHSFSSFNAIYEANETNSGLLGKALGVDPTEKSKLYDQTLGMILSTILNSYASLVSYPEKPYDQNIDADLASVKSAPIDAKSAGFGKIMDRVKDAGADNKNPGASEAMDAWIASGNKAAEALTAIINQYKDQPEEKAHINDFINASLDNYLKEIGEASKENPLKKGISGLLTKESQNHLFEGILQGKKGMIEDVSKKITLVMAKLGSMANTPGMKDEVSKLQSEVATIAAQMGELLNKKNNEINKDDIKKADARLTEIPTLLDKKAEQMLKQDSTNKEAASILVQALDLVAKAKQAENQYIKNKEEAAAKEVVTYSEDKVKEVNPTVKKFQELVISKLGGSKQISSLPSFKKMGSDGKYGPSTKQMVSIVKSGFDLKDTSGDTITGEVIKELEKQEPLKESRVFKFDQFVGESLNEAFDTEKATATSKKVTPAPAKVSGGGGAKGGSTSTKTKLLFKKGDSGNAVIAINRIVGQTSDEKNYTDDTVNRVKDFQTANNLYKDGIAGEDTLKKLYNTREGAKPKSVLNDEKAVRGQWAYNMLAKILQDVYTPTKGEEIKTGGTLSDTDLLGETDGLSSFINTILPAAKYAAFISPSLWVPAAFMTAADAFKDRRTGVKGVVDAVDGWVKESDLAYVLTVLKALAGKKMKDGKSAIQRFKELYKMDEGEDLIEDIQSVGTNTMSVKGDLIKEEILKLLGA